MSGNGEAPAKPVLASVAKFVLHKFGGSSLASADCFKKVAKIIIAEQHVHRKVAVVVSAMGGKPKVTDLLLSLIDLALNANTTGYDAVIETIKTKHIDVINELIDESGRQSLIAKISKDLDGIRVILQAVTIMKLADARVTGIVGGHGELWSAQILAALLSQSTANGGGGVPYHFLDARKTLVIASEIVAAGPEVLWEETEAKLPTEMVTEDGVAWTNMVITGFVASTHDGVMTTLQRDGSDFSASIFGKLLKARTVTIWTDVSGVLSADPRRVSNAK
jgi:aspartokinase/homoserine dehydrogenase 1